MNQISKRILGKTGVEISEIGFGAWPIGGSQYGKTSDKDGIEAIEAYLDAGGNHIDTARLYGKSEMLIGEVLGSGRRDKIFLASKTAKGDCMETIPEIRKELEETLNLLKTDYLDLYYLHLPPDDEDVMHRAIDEFEALRQEGKIRLVGASIKAVNVTPAIVQLCNQYINSGRVQVIQVVYSILRQLNSKMFENAYNKGVGIIARTALESGFLSGKYKPGHVFKGDIKIDHRNRWSSEKQKKIFEIVEEMKSWAIVPPYKNLAQVAIKYSLFPKEISSLIVGARNSNQVKMNVDAASLPNIELGVVEKINQEYSEMAELVNIG